MILNQLIKDFLDYLEIEKNRSPKTRENYARYLKRFVFWLENETNKSATSLDASYINNDNVRKYRLWLNRQKNSDDEILKRNTQAYHIIALRSFLKYLTRRDIKTLAAEKIELPKIPSRELDLISIEELNRLLSAPDTNTLPGKRDKAILETFFSTGLRVSELCKLNRDNINLKRGEFSVKGKGGKIRVVFLSERAKKSISTYLEKRLDIEEPLFVNISRSKKIKESLRLSPRSIERIVKKYALATGIMKKMVPHTLRHAFATDLLQNGADLRSVQIMLGHASITTTQVYTHLTDKELQQIHLTFHGKRLRK
ncbi:MAG: tyrosine-type recombinase/integrase [Candidatus Parcubacteria bacterium]|nr:tyrosine-type recombinase/integrase [Candidatus Parcubacteria bacterium]